MTGLPVGTSLGSCRILRWVAQSPVGTLYHAFQGDRPVTLRVLSEQVDSATRGRFLEDARRLIGLSHPNVLRVEAVGQEGQVQYLIEEWFESASLKELGSRSLAEGSRILLGATQALSAAWMRLILHRNLSPEAIRVSQNGEVKLTDFGFFQGPTPYWSPERCAGRTPDIRGDLFSLGTIFKEYLKEKDPGIETLLDQMTKAEPFDRLQMVEEAVSRLEAYCASTSAPAATPAAAPPASLPAVMPIPEPDSLPLPPSVPKFPESEISFPLQPPLPGLSSFVPGESPFVDSELTEARRSLLNALSSVLRKKTASDPTVPVLLSAYAGDESQKPAIVVAERWTARTSENLRTDPQVFTHQVPSIPRPRPRSAFLARALLVLFILVVALRFAVRISRLLPSRRPAASTSLRRPSPAKSPVAATGSPLRESLPNRASQDWRDARVRIELLESQSRYDDALRECRKVVARLSDQAPPESRATLEELEKWTGLIQEAERARRIGDGPAALAALHGGGPMRSKDAERLLAFWCEKDWSEAQLQVKRAISQSDVPTARDWLEQFLKGAHQGGAHREEARAQLLGFQCDRDFRDAADQAERAQRMRKDSLEVEAWESFLGKPHQGGVHREEARELLAKARMEVKETIYSGPRPITRLALDPKGTRVAFTSDRMRIVDLSSREEGWAPEVRSLLRTLTFAGDSQLLGAMSTKILCWDLDQKKELRALLLPDGAISNMVMSAEGKRVVVLETSGGILSWKPGEDSPTPLGKMSAPGVQALALSPDGMRLALASRDKAIRIRDLGTSQERSWTGLKSPATALAFSPDGKRLASGGSDEDVTVWEVEKGEPALTLAGHQGNVTSLAFSPDGSRVAAGGSEPPIHVWDARTGAIEKVYRGHRGRVTQIAFLPDGRIVSGSAEGRVRLWSVKD